MSSHSFDAVIFDLDGVVTRTALVHGKAWKLTFEEYLHVREKRDGEAFREFSHEHDYLPYVDGKPRYKGVQSFLESRGIHIPFGDPSDPAGKETVCGIGNKKNLMFRDVLAKQGAEIYPSTIEFIKVLKKSGVRVGVASSSKNCQLILKTAHFEKMFETRVDGEVSAQLGLKGKPEGDIFVTAARNLGADPGKAIVVEDATSGVEAGRNGGFGLVLGIARQHNETQLLENGADIVVQDMADIDIETIERWFQRKPKPLFQNWDTQAKAINAELKKEKLLVNSYYSRGAQSVFVGGKKVIFFLDYDGTLTPIVERPELAVMSSDMRQVVTNLSKKHMIAIVSGRQREDVENLVKIPGLFYAGSHGFDIKGPEFSLIQTKAQEVIPVVSKVIEQLKKELGTITGVLIEEKKFSVAVHYRLADEKKHLSKITRVVNAVIQNNKELRLMSGKKVFELLPNIEWNKGMAIRWIMEALKLSWSETSVIYIGDDVTDEYAFRTVRTRGTGILVSEKNKESAADFHLSSPREVKKLFEKLIAS